MADDDPYGYLASVSAHPDRAGDTSNFNPKFASALAAAIRQANAAGMHVGVGSGFREPMQTQSQGGAAAAYDAAGNSGHTYGLASDISGLDGPNGPATKQWAAIAGANGLYNPYGVGNALESNHWQFYPTPNIPPNTLAALKTAKATGDMSKVWAASAPLTGETGGTQYAGPGVPQPSGTRINSANAPVAGALANQGPESVGQGNPSATSTGPQDPRQIVFNKLIAAGVPKQAALGALWSLGGEGGKGLDPRSYNANDPGGSIGYGQWNQTRRTALEGLAKQDGTSWADPNTQADHIVNELTNKDYATYQPGVLAALQKAQTPEEATAIWTSKYERPAVDNSADRIKGGSQVATLDDSGNLVLGSATGGGPAPSSTAPGSPAVASTPAAPQSWWDKLTGSPVNAQGNPTGASSPLDQATSAFTTGLARNQARDEAQQRAEAPQESPAAAQYAQARYAPGGRNISPGLASVPQTYGTTINAASQPLTWTDAPPGPPKMAQAGLKGPMYAPAPGVSLNSIPLQPQGTGYGVDPNIGYGYG